jgi:signal transduction histidine kinase
VDTPHGPRPDIPSQVAFDDLLAARLRRTSNSVGMRDGLWRLVEAIVQVASAELSLASVLDRLVRVARDMVDAQYAALGVIADDGTLREFVHAGVDDATAARIGHLPEGHGILGLLIREPQVLRLDDLAAHPSSVGFPVHHPPMDTFLGVPIAVGDRIYGNLYLTNRRDGEPFTDDDAELVRLLAAAAAVVIDNARVHELALRRQHWLEASRDLTASLLGGTDIGGIQRFIVDRTLSLTDGATCTLALVHGKALTVVAAAGMYAEQLGGRGFPLDGSIAQPAVEDRRAVVVEDLASTAIASAGFVPLDAYGPAMLLPLLVRGSVVAVVAVAREKGREAFTTDDVRMADDFGAQAAVALDYGHAQAERRRAAVLRDRERIGHDLHDLVIQRLFATGLSLDSLAGRVAGTEVAPRLVDAVDEIDAAIADLRSSIFGLHARRRGTTRTSDQIEEICAASTQVLGFAPRVDADRAAADAVPDELVPDLLATLRELLSNVGRHAEAARVEVRLHRPDPMILRLEVTDDGRGMPGDVRRSGLANLAARAERTGGSMRIDSDGDGTTVAWCVPLP